MRPWNEIIAEARDRNKEKAEKQRRLKIAKTNLKGSGALEKAQGKRKSRLSPDELKLRKRDTKVRERRQDTREQEAKRKKEHSAWVIGQSQKNAEERKRKQLEDIKNKPRQSASAALSDIKTQSISYKDSDATAYTKVVGNVGSLVGGVAKAGIRYAIEKNKAKKAATEAEKKDGGGSVPPSPPGGGSGGSKKSGPVRPSIGTVTGPASNPKRSYNEGYSNWKEDFIIEVEDKTDNKKEKKKIIDVLPLNKPNKIEINPNIKEEKDEEGGMAHNELATMERAVKTLRKKIKSPNQQLPAWVQSKITKAADHIDSVADYMSGETEKVTEGYDEGDETFRQHSRETFASQSPSKRRSITASVLKKMKELNASVEKPKKKKKKKAVAEECGGGDDGKKILMMAILKKAVDSKKKKNSQLNSGIIGEESPAWQRKEGKNPEGGLNAKGRASAKAQGHNLKPPVTTPPSKLDPDSKSAKRRKSFCARMGGMPGPMKDEKGRPTRKALSLRKWNC